MLVQLEIRNIALIDHVSIELADGLNVLSGETGAGKSIIIDSINAILGGRVSKDIIRTGKEKAMVEAVFQVDAERVRDLLEGYGIEPEEDNTLVVSREFNIHGKSICRINGKMATVSMLRELGERIIDVHGQYDNQSLLRTENHIKLLDSFGGEHIEKLKLEYAQALQKYKSICNRIKELSGNSGERERRIDLLKYQIDEIRKAGLKIGEEEELNKQRLLLSNSEKVLGALSKAYELLYTGVDGSMSASDGINEAIQCISTVANLDVKYESISKKLEDLYYQLEDAAEEIRSERDKVEYNPELLESIDERIDLIFRLKKKYGQSIRDILEYCEKIEQELEEIISSEEIIKKLQSQMKEADNELYALSCKLNEERHKAAQILEDRIGNELDDLEMKKAKFKVDILFDQEPDSSGHRPYNSSGLNHVEFLISPNAGEPLKPLSKIASGGEMSRVMLAIKNILANVDSMPTLIFDEIDTGISGRAAQKVGEKLSYISKKHQVICVTHLAQIACMADSHYLIEKVSDDVSTETRVVKLEGKAVDNEIARILGGASISDTTLKYAKELLQNARKFKKSACI